MMSAVKNCKKKLEKLRKKHQLKSNKVIFVKLMTNLLPFAQPIVSANRNRTYPTLSLNLANTALVLSKFQQSVEAGIH